ncbi:MAG: hypothetical protein AAGA90_15645 [Actinomycetota bacterium]
MTISLEPPHDLVRPETLRSLLAKGTSLAGLTDISGYSRLTERLVDATVLPKDMRQRQAEIDRAEVEELLAGRATVPLTVGRTRGWWQSLVEDLAWSAEVLVDLDLATEAIAALDPVGRRWIATEAKVVSGGDA